jgi:RNA polymerase sigma-70 factor (ECF subfamily)
MVEEATIIARAKAGDGRAFEQLLDRYETTVFNAAYRMVLNHEDAADITQTVFLKVYRYLDSYDPGRKFFSWIYRIAVNESINHLRRNRPEVALEGDFVSPEDGLLDRIAGDERSDGIQRALAMLKPDYRVVIVLKYFLELPYSEISEIAGIPEKTVKSRLHTGRELLRKALTKQGIER